MAKTSYLQIHCLLFGAVSLSELYGVRRLGLFFKLLTQWSKVNALDTQPISFGGERIDDSK